MAAGGFDEMEMGERGEKYPEYDDLSTEDLDTNLNELRERLQNGDDPLVTERITYIVNLQRVRQNTGLPNLITSFGGIRVNAYAQVETFFQDSLKIRIDPHTESALEIRSRVGVDERNGNITFKEIKRDGLRADYIRIVLVRRVDSFLFNPNETRALSQFKDLIDKAKKETKTRLKTTAGLPMIDVRGSELSSDVFNRLSKKHQSEVNGALNPTGTTLPESRIGMGKALQIEAKRFREMGDQAIKDANNTSNVDISGDLYQKGEDYGEVANAIERQEKKEATRVVQEEDVTRLQKVKEWLKENWLGDYCSISNHNHYCWYENSHNKRSTSDNVIR